MPRNRTTQPILTALVSLALIAITAATASREGSSPVITRKPTLEQTIPAKDIYRPRDAAELNTFIGRQRGTLWIWGGLLYPTLEGDALEGLKAKRLEVKVITGNGQSGAFAKLKSAGAELKTLGSSFSGGFLSIGRYTVVRDAKGIVIYDNLELSAVVQYQVARVWNATNAR